METYQTVDNLWRQPHIRYKRGVWI